MSYSKEYYERLGIIEEEFKSYIENSSVLAIIDLLMEEFCQMDEDEALNTFNWLWDDPKERSQLLLAINS
jgi:hypothetical protein